MDLVTLLGMLDRDEVQKAKEHITWQIIRDEAEGTLFESANHPERISIEALERKGLIITARVEYNGRRGSVKIDLSKCMEYRW